MASLIKVRHLPFILKRTTLNNLYNAHRGVTSRPDECQPDQPKCQPCEHVTATETKEKENWVSYGFDYNNKEEDSNVHHASFFFSVSLCLIFGGFVWAYAPDVHLRDWAQREAFLELRRREKAGLPLIDPNYVPPGTVKLPSEKELSEVGVII